MAAILRVCDRDLRDLGVEVRTITGVVDGLAFEWEAVSLPAHYGLQPVSPEAPASMRPLVVQGHVRGTSIDTAYEAIKAWCGRGMCELRTGLNAEKVFYGWYRDVRGELPHPMLRRSWGQITLRWDVFSPLGYDRFARVLTLGSDPTPIPQASGPVTGTIRVTGPTTSPLLITLRNHAGRPLAFLQLGEAGNAFTLGSTDYVVIDSPGRSITKVAAGVSSEALSFLTGPSTFPLVIGRDDADLEGQGWATLEVSGLGTNASAEYLHLRTYQ